MEDKEQLIYDFFDELDTFVEAKISLSKINSGEEWQAHDEQYTRLHEAKSKMNDLLTTLTT